MTTTDPGPAFHLGVLPGLTPRLMTAAGPRESLADYLATDGYRALPAPEDLVALVEAAGLRGRGGASFPTGRKLRSVREGRSTPVVVANGEEGEPTSVKDRWLMRSRPHLVLDGVRHAAAAVGADLAYVYLSDAEAEASVRDALAEAPPVDVEVHVVRVDPTYVAGEETAAVSVLNGGAALPTDKPPRPYEFGVAGRPTLVSNVETLANLPAVTRLGAAGYREVGTGRSPGTFLLTLGGACSRPGLYEVPLGVGLGAALDTLSDQPATPTGYLVGGYFGGLLAPVKSAVALDYDELTAEGSGLGCGAVTILGADDCPVRVAADVMNYFGRENAAQCGSCFNGTAAMSSVLDLIARGVAGGDEVNRLAHWSVFLRRRGACGTLDGAAQLAGSLLREFPGLIQDHLDATCVTCAGRGDTPPARRPFEIEVPSAHPVLSRS